ncbi:MAG: sialate O-acetylesterase [Phycisphaerae bacterium]|nr:sialate O-acetylesterase [Phycisphaerae bacterium]
MRRAMSVLVFMAIGVGAAGSSAPAAVKLHGLFTDNMVLQQAQKVPVWGTADEGEKVTVAFCGQEVSATAKDGKWTVWLKPLKAGGPFEMTVKASNAVALENVLVGEVWICSGQSNMGFPVSHSAGAGQVIAESANPMIRLFTVERTPSGKPLSEVTVGHPWVEAGPKTVGGFSAVGYFFGKELQAAIKVPVGLINSSWGGTSAQAWTQHEALASDPALKAYLDRWERYLKTDYPKQKAAYPARLAKWQQTAKAAKAAGKNVPRKPPVPAGPDSQRQPSALFNGMIHPLLPYAIRGAIWYQGESNAGEGDLYRKLFPAMIANWRQVWGQGDFPFLFVQLAPFEGKADQPPWAEIRESQLVTAQKVPGVGMAVITDLGERKDIHPKRKAPVGARLALAARAIAYGEKIVYSGPEYSGMKVEGGKVVLNFKHVGSGLVAKDGPLRGFTIAGKDRKFVEAQAEIRGDTVIVSSPKVPQPAAVRYAWSNFPEVNLYNKEGLPATPFRTDDFPLVTQSGGRRSAAPKAKK